MSPSRLASYNAARFKDWQPELHHEHQASGLGCLLQVTPEGALGANETIVSANPSNVLLFWTKPSQVEAALNSAHLVSFRPRPWDFTLLPAGCDSGWLSNPSAADGVLHLHLDQKFLAQIAQAEDLPSDASSLAVRLVAGVPFLAELARWILEEVRAPRPVTRLTWETAATTLALQLLRLERPPKASARGGLAPWQLRRVCDQMQSDLCADPGLAELAALVDLSAEHFCRAFKASTGLPPHAWFVAHRVERARELLDSTNLPVEEVAAQVGYAEPSHFARMFRRTHGRSPTQYRRERRL